MKTKEKAEKMNKSPLGLKEGAGYMMGDAGNLFVLTYVSSFLKIFYTDVLKINAKKAAHLFLFTRLWDAVNDPLWGNIVSKRRPTVNGKYRPYIKALAIPLAVSELLCFFNFGRFTNNQILLLVFAYITYIAFGMLYTGVNVPYGSLASVITDNPEGRTLLSTARSVGAGIGGAAPLLIAPLLIYNKVSDGNSGTYNVANGNGMFTFAVIMAVCAVFSYFFCYSATKERVPSAAEPQFNMKATYSALFRSRPFIHLALSGILISGQLQFNSLNQYLYKNYFCNTNLSILGTIAQYLPMAVMIPFVPKLVQRYGKKEIITFGTFFSALASIITYIAKPGRDQPMFFIVMLFIIGFGYSFVSITNWAVVTDVIDYQEYKTGMKCESSIYAVYTFCRKLGQTAADYGGLMLLSKVGYDVSTMSSAGYVSGVSEGILTVCTLIPAIVYTLIFIIFKFGYPLTKKKLVPVYEYIKNRNETK
ncbi:MAG: glycoside-pentoside-hexuronide (GPH):cation symporter [Clostridiales bacterium]|nr:glycoside-pentoside-hexuronide (GPH):cation symporter [Clostridiales bacterium]